MGFCVWIEIVCKGCATTRLGQYVTGTIPRASIKREALKCGWKLIGNDWLCKVCENKGVKE